MKEIILATLIVFAALPALTHPPESIHMNFEPESSIAVIEIEHSVRDVSAHYIKEVNISLNGEEILTQSFSRQSAPSSQQAVYYLHEVSEGDNIEVLASCSLSGSLNRIFEITLPEDEDPEEE